ncbi:hypothetical protein ACS0TY_007202 [Phlomoides rotata]
MAPQNQNSLLLEVTVGGCGRDEECIIFGGRDEECIYKDSCPGYWDISSAGHISAGDSSLVSARRELHEELGISLPKDAFELLFIFLEEGVLNDGKFINNEYENVYLVTTIYPIPLEAFTLHEFEVSAVKYMHYEGYRSLLAKEDPSYVPYDVNVKYVQLFEILSSRYKQNAETRALILQKQLNRYAHVSLVAELTGLSNKDNEALTLIVKAARIMDDTFFLQCPWSSLDENEAFFTTGDSAVKLLSEATKPVNGWKGIEYRMAFPVAKPPGANFYPPDMDKMEFELWYSLPKDKQEEATGFFNVIKRKSERLLDESPPLSMPPSSNSDAHDLYIVPYSEEYNAFLTKASDLLHKAGDVASSSSLKNLILIGVKFVSEKEDPFSPLLFCLAEDVPARMLDASVTKRSYFLLLLCIKRILGKYGEMSGQIFNPAKSKAFFGWQVPRQSIRWIKWDSVQFLGLDFVPVRRRGFRHAVHKVQNINKEARWILRKTSSIRFWLDNCLGYVITDRIGIPQFVREFIDFTVSDYFYNESWHLDELFVIKYLDIIEDIMKYTCEAEHDTLIWPFTIHGDLSSKAAYRGIQPHFPEKKISSQVTAVWRLCIVTSLWLIWDSRNKAMFEEVQLRTTNIITTLWALIRESDSLSIGYINNTHFDLEVLAELEVSYSEEHQMAMSAAFIHEVSNDFTRDMYCNQHGIDTILMEYDSLYVVQCFQNKDPVIPWCLLSLWHRAIEKLRDMRLVVSYIYECYNIYINPGASGRN